MSTSISESRFQVLKDLFARPVCQRATQPLRDGTEIAVFIDEEGPATLQKLGGAFEAVAHAPRKPDMTFVVPNRALDQLAATTTEDIGEIGVEILKLMASPEAELRITAKVHIGLFDILRHGYLSVLPLGGASVMKFLGSKGFGGIGKIKDAISRLRT